jgi:WD40 repeat protein
VSPNGKVVALGDSSSLFLDDVSKNGITSMLIDHDFPVCDMDFSADDRLLFGYSPGDAVQVWNVQTGARLGFRRNFWPRFQETPVRWRCLGNSFAIHPKGHITATAGESDISSVSVTDEYSTTFFEGHEQIVQSVTFSPDGLLLASGSDDKTIRLWEMASGKQLAVIRGHETGIQVLSFSRDSAWLSSGDANGEVRLWDATTGKSIGKPMRGSSAAVSSLAFNPDKTQLISGDTEGFLYLWNIATGDLLTSIPAHITGVRRIIFSSNGNLFVSIGESAKLWNIVTQGG